MITRLLILIPAFLFLIGCKPNAPVSLVTIDQESSPSIPPHPMLERMVGEWGEFGDPYWIIREDESLGFVIEDPPNEVWATVINNVHWKENILCFDNYSYVVDGSPYSDTHPFNGVAVHVELRLTENPDVIEYASVSKDLDDEISIQIERIEQPDP